MAYPDFLDFFLSVIRACGERLIFTDFIVAFLSVAFFMGVFVKLLRVLLFGGRL